MPRSSFTRLITITALLATLVYPIHAAAQSTIGTCQVFPADNPWNTDISASPVHPDSDNIITRIDSLGGDFVHPDFGSNPTYGIPYIAVTGTQPKVPVTFDYADESDSGPYPVPPNAPVEAGSDRHVIVIDSDGCVLYELYDAHYASGAWTAGSGAIFNLDSNALRPDGWTSADAAGLPIFPGLARCDEVMAGEITHALRFTVTRTRRAYVYPATHFASSSTNAYDPPMGLRFRLRSSYDLSGFSGQALVIARALKKYGMIVADNGSNWFISGEQDRDRCWDDDELNQLKTLPGTAFEVIVSPPAAPITFNPPKLRAPTNGSAITTEQPVLDWNAVTGSTAYELQIGHTNPPSTLAISRSMTEPTVYKPLVPLYPGFTYFWRARAKYGPPASSSFTSWSAAYSFTIVSPTGAAPTRNFYTTSPVIFRWNRVTGALEYELQVASNPGFASPQIWLVSAATLQQDVPLSEGRYYWRVRARTMSGSWGNWSQTEVMLVMP